MNAKELIARIASIVTTLAEQGGAPESTLYMFLDSDLVLWNRIRDAMVTDGTIEVKGHFVTITDKGRAQAAMLEALVAGR